MASVATTIQVLTGPNTMNSQKYIQKAIVMCQSGNFSGACTAMDNYCKKNTHDIDAWMLLGNIYGQIQKLTEAAACFRHVLGINKAATGATLSLARTHHQLGEYGKAIELYLITIKHSPENWSHYFLLGNAYKEIGDYPKAVNAYARALNLSSENLEILNNLAGAYAMTGDYRRSEKCYKKILDLNPHHAETYANLSRLHQSQGAYTLALDWIEKAISNDQNNHVYHKLRGSYYVACSRFREACDSFNKAVEIRTDDINSWLQLANTYLAQGKTDDAIRVFNKLRLMNVDPENVSAGMALAYELKAEHHFALKELEPYLGAAKLSPAIATIYGMVAPQVKLEDDAIIKLGKTIQHQDTSAADKQRVHFVLGNLYDIKDRYDDAFRNYQAANNLYTHDASIARHTKLFDRYIEFFDRHYFSSAPVIAAGTYVPIFIVGMPRSGTSLAEKILSSHPDVYGAGELDNIYRIAQGMPGQYPECLKDMPADTLKQLANEHLANLATYSDGHKYTVDKMPSNFLYLGLIHVLFPNAKIIHCLRHPIDTCLSCYFQDFGVRLPYASDLTALGQYYKLYDRLMTHWKEVLTMPIYDLKYEALVADQAGESKRIFEFCGLEWDTQYLNYHEDKRLINTASYNQVRKPIYNRSVNKWMRYKSHLKPLINELDN